MPTIKQTPDESGCNHSLNGPIRKDDKFEYGFCDTCNQEVAIQLNKTGERTGKSWIVGITS